MVESRAMLSPSVFSFPRFCLVRQPVSTSLKFPTDFLALFIYCRDVMTEPWSFAGELLRSVWFVMLLGAFPYVANAETTSQTGPQGSTLAQVQVAFTPGDDAAGLIISAIKQARRQVLIQAYSFTHDGIAQALIAVHRRGLDVRVIADRGQTENMERGQVPGLARAGVPVWLDGEHQSAHNKVMVIDAGQTSAVLITGSFNFTRAAQYKNAENVLFIRGNDVLMQGYARNWQQHLTHSSPLRLH